MKDKMKIKLGLCAVAAALAVIGLCFTWKCPLDCVYGIDSGVFFFRKQLLWNGIGIAACAVAALVPWRRWLGFAPWGMVVWLGLSAAAMLCASHHGSHRWADFGFVRVNVHLVLVFAWAIFAAWLCSKKCIKPWMVFAVVGVLLVGAAVSVLGNANRLARLGVFFGSEDGNRMYAYAQMQMKAAYATAHWFGDADRSLRFLPLAYADAMPSAAVLLFGKWFTLVVAALFFLFGGLLTWIWLTIRNPSKRMFILFWGGAMTLTAVYSFFQSVGWVPVLGFSPSIAAYGGGFAVVFWLGIGVLLSLLSDAPEDFPEGTRTKAIAAGGVWAALFVLFAFGVVIVSNFELKFYATLPRASDFGGFGPSAKRGEILASDGSVLARSVKSWSLRLDPKTAREYDTAFDPYAVTNICPRLGLTPMKLLNLCNIEKSRYVLVRKEIDESVAKWFLSSEGRRHSKGFIIETLQKREYPLGSNAVHVTGCIHRWPGRTTEGATGLESSFNTVLAGKYGVLVRDAGRAEQLALGRPIHGGCVTTTVVPAIQNALADALCEAMASNRSETAWGIVIDVKTGGIAAMASLPAYDPAGSRDLKEGPNYFMNNAAMSVFEPGGLMKPLTYAMAFDKEVVKPDAGLDHGGGVWEYNGTKLYDVSGVTGVLTVAEAFVKRTDIGAAKTGLMIWKDVYPDGLEKFGFGHKISRGTVYGEETGIVRPANKVDPVTFSRLGLGRGLAVTGLQIANAYAALANGGITIAPHLVSKVVSTNGVESLFKPGKPSVAAVSDAAAKQVAALMKDAMMAAAKEFSVDFGGIEVAGMISESRIPINHGYSDTEYNVSAAGFFPANNPKWVLAIGFSKPRPDHSAGRVALPAFADVVRKITSDSQK